MGTAEKIDEGKYQGKVRVNTTDFANFFNALFNFLVPGSPRMSIEHEVIFLGRRRVIRRPVKTTVWERTWGSIMGEENRYFVIFSLEKYNAELHLE